MLKNKNVLFITHHNNDLDHFLPLAVHLKKYKKVHVKMIAFYTEHELLKNKLHKYICDSNEINFDSMLDVMNFGFLNKPIFKIYRYAIMNRKLSNPSRIINKPDPNESKQRINTLKNTFFKSAHIFKSPTTSISELLNIILIRYVVLCSIFFMTKKKTLNYLDSNNIDLVIIDGRTFEQSSLDSNPFRRFVDVFTRKVQHMDLVLFRFAKYAKDKNIPILMMPHAPHILLKSDGECKKLIDPFKPDYLVMSSQHDLIVNPHMQSRKFIFFLGDPRFDIDWINYLDSCALKVYKGVLEKPKDKKVILCLLDNAIHESHKRFKLYKEIISLVNDFNCIEIWVKHHPRNVFDFPLDDIVQNDFKKNIKQFGNDVDTSILIANADICITAGSSTLITPILQKRPVIYYTTLEEKQNVPTLYDDLKFNAYSKEELIIRCEKVINGEYEIEDSYLDYFYKNIFAGNYLYENMTKKYGDKIEKIINGDYNLQKQ